MSNVTTYRPDCAKCGVTFAGKSGAAFFTCDSCGAPRGWIDRHGIPHGEHGIRSNNPLDDLLGQMFGNQK